MKKEEDPKVKTEGAAVKQEIKPKVEPVDSPPTGGKGDPMDVDESDDCSPKESSPPDNSMNARKRRLESAEMRVWCKIQKREYDEEFTELERQRDRLQKEFKDALLGGAVGGESTQHDESTPGITPPKPMMDVLEIKPYEFRYEDPDHQQYSADSDAEDNDVVAYAEAAAAGRGASAAHSKKAPHVTYTQIPLRVAYAISMHKSQGQTLSRVHIDASDIFDAGQFYVAMSRCQTLGGIRLVGFHPKCIRASPRGRQVLRRVEGGEWVLDGEVAEGVGGKCGAASQASGEREAASRTARAGTAGGYISGGGDLSQGNTRPPPPRSNRSPRKIPPRKLPPDLPTAAAP